MATTALHPAARTYRSTLYEWITTTDHKKIGIMYLINSFIFFFIGGLLAIGVRTELAQPGLQFVQDQVYNELFTMHATFMIFLFIIPILAGFGNFIVPLHIGAPDVAFPRINALSLWMLPMAGILLLLSFFVGSAPAAGWTSYPPLTEDRPLGMTGPGQDLWLVAVVLVGTSSILGAVNFLVTIFKMRAPGMTLFRMPLVVWSLFITAVLLLLALPVLTSAVAMLLFDRTLGTSWFSPSGGGEPLLWQHLFWYFGHPEVYILILPAMGIVSDVLPTFARKPLFGYPTVVFAGAVIAFLGFGVWAHHMFTTGLGPWVTGAFAITTMAIAVPTGVKIFNWLATLWGGAIRFDTPLLFAVGFISMFLLGGLSGNPAECRRVHFRQQLIADLGFRIELLSGFLESDLQRRIIDVFHHRFGLKQLDFADLRVELRLDLSLMTESFFRSRDHGVLQSADENCFVDAFFFADLFDDSIEILLHITHSSRVHNWTYQSWQKGSDV